jgi:hypothetical protein
VKASAIFFAFLLLFTSASIAVPIPLFPGNMVSTLVEVPAAEYIVYLEAFTNGVTYAFITWAVFFLLVRKIESSMSMEPKKRPDEKRGLSAY